MKTVFTKDGVEVEKGTNKYKGHIFYDEDGGKYKCLGYFPKLDDCVYENLQTGKEVVGCMDGFYFKDPTKKYAKGSTIKGGGVTVKGKSASFYLSSHKEMFDDNAKTITKKDIADFIIISKNSDEKYWVKDINTKYSYYIYKGDLRLNDGTGGIFSTTKIGLDRLKDEHRFKIKEENLYNWEKELEKDMLKRADPNYKKPVWETIVDKFNDIYFLDGSLISNYKENELSSSQVKARGSNNGYYSYEFRNISPLLSWKEAEDKFKQSLTADELNSIEISYKKEKYADLEEHDTEKYHKQIFVKLKKYANGGNTTSGFNYTIGGL